MQSPSTNPFSPRAKETRPLLGSLAESTTQRIWLTCIITGLVVAWCVLDSWNHDMSSHLFQMSEEHGLSVPQTFKYTLTLAFLQFAFMAFVFCAIFMARVASSDESISKHIAPLQQTLSDGRWPALVTTHIFGSVLLQSLMMPAYMMSLSLFAATRAVEIPIAASVRGKVFGPRTSAPSMRTIMLMFAAAWLLFFSYTQIAECLCVWSGFGVALSGVALYFVYAALLTIPATNVVLQESVMVQLQVSPLLMQAVQNLCATLLLVPVMMAAHWLGYEDIPHALAMIVSHRGIYMTVLWLCVQTLLLSSVTIGMILTMDSFWAVALRSLRVVYWWSRQLQLFYLTSSTLISVARPHASLWSLVMVFGIAIGLVAFSTDRRETQDVAEDKALLASAERETVSGLAKYV